MILAALAVAAVLASPNVLTADVGLWASANWGPNRPDIYIIVENRSNTPANAIQANCKVYDASGLLIATPTAYFSNMGPHEALRMAATDLSGDFKSARFNCHIKAERGGS